MEIACQRSFAMSFSGAFCAGLIEAERGLLYGMQLRDCFPALFAPASLKLTDGTLTDDHGWQFSGAFCAGLIEAADFRYTFARKNLVFRRFLRRPH